MKVIKVWADPRSLATTDGIIGYFLFLGVLRCFSSPAYRSPVLYIQTGATRHNSGGVSPFGHLRIEAYLAAPRSFSQLITSFIGILRQGILCAHLSNFLRLNSKPCFRPKPGSIAYYQCNWLVIGTYKCKPIAVCRIYRLRKKTDGIFIAYLESSWLEMIQLCQIVELHKLKDLIACLGR